MYVVARTGARDSEVSSTCAFSLTLSSCVEDIANDFGIGPIALKGVNLRQQQR